LSSFYCPSGSSLLPFAPISFAGLATGLFLAACSQSVLFCNVVAFYPSFGHLPLESEFFLIMDGASLFFFIPLNSRFSVRKLFSGRPISALAVLPSVSHCPPHHPVRSVPYPDNPPHAHVFPYQFPDITLVRPPLAVPALVAYEHVFWRPKSKL